MYKVYTNMSQQLPQPPTSSLRHHLIAHNGQIKWEPVNPPKKRHLFILAGQSNCQSANPGPLTPDDAPHPRVFMMSQGIDKVYQDNQMTKPPYEVAPKGTWQVAQDPLQHRFISHTASVGFGLTFAKEYLKTLGPEDEVYLLCGAYGGSGFTQVDFGMGPISWLKGFDGYLALYDKLVEDTQHALASTPGLELKGFLWHQGETDVGNPNYMYQLYTMINDFRTQFNNPNLPFVCGTMLKSWKDSKDGAEVFVDNTHKYISNMVWLADCAQFDDLTGAADEVHYDAQSQRIMGRRYYDKFVELEAKRLKAIEEWIKNHPQ